jgi:LAO/AO transport system kinase
VSDSRKRDPGDSQIDDLETLVEGVMAGDRGLLARAITRVESRHPEQARLGQEVLARVLPLTGGSMRIGVSGVPGVGKSTLIDALGALLLERGLRVAVLAVDPSSTVSGGSILGDKSRMPRLAGDERAFIRPSPTAQGLGGVARRTLEALLLCEAAGFDVVLIETVGVGQSELEVADMVDFFLLLLLPGTGDELQGIKKGIVELADALAVNKADGNLLDQARQTRAEYVAALHYLEGQREGWKPQVVAVSARTGEGIEALWDLVQQHREWLESSGALAERRDSQRRKWLWRLLEEGVMDAFRADEAVRVRIGALEGAVRRGERTAADAASELLSVYLDKTN